MEALLNSPVKVEDLTVSTPNQISPAWTAQLAGRPSMLLSQMFREPRLLEPSERQDLIAHLRSAVESQPEIAEIRVLLGMALCTDLQAQEAMEQLREAVQQAPDCFIARLKFGELLMRLRICDQAQKETHEAARLAANAMQAEMARKQAATIREMLREGVERGGYAGVLPKLNPFKRKSRSTEMIPNLASSR